MSQEISRRDFLKATAVTGTVFLAGDMLRSRTFGETSVKIPEAERIVVTVITDNYYDAMRPDYKIAKRYSNTVWGILPTLDLILHAEHGLAYHVETTVDGRSHTFLFDFASDAQGINRNMQLLKIDLKKIEAMALSHDHFDHQAALLDLLKGHSEEIPQGIPFYVGEQFFQGTFGRMPDGKIVSLAALRRQDVEESGLVKVVEVKSPTPIVQGAYLSGKIEKVTEYEKGSPFEVARKGDQFVHEEFPGEQAVVLNAKGKGLVVLSACAHRGIVNTVRHAQKITGIEKIHAVIGGFHLMGAEREVIRQTIADIKTLRPDYIVPMHCTGFEVVEAFAREMPDQFILNVAGTRYVMPA
jgi:7,8-dihydropterin-6-yl-methyl-4-(beta-D-ribofuranosyl)aminobenzene 5'-phosphate synthase